MGVENLLDAKIYEESNAYLCIVTDESNAFEYRWSKNIPEGQLLEDYLQSCKREALLLADLEIIQNQPAKEIFIQLSE